MFACLHLPSAPLAAAPHLIEITRHFSPHAESLDERTVVFSIAGLRRLIGSPSAIASELSRRAHERGLSGNIAIARHPDLAILAARYLRGVTLMEPGQESRWLGMLPLTVLPLRPDSQSVLAQWGIRTLEEFCGLPEDGLTERLGADAAFLKKLARGEWQRPLDLPPPRTDYSTHLDLEHPLDNLELLAFLLARHLQDLCERLHRQSMAASQVRLHLILERADPHLRSLHLPVPSRDHRSLWRLLQLDLEAHPPAAPVTAFTLSVDPVEPRYVQHDLYTPPSPEPERLELTLAKIRARVGESEAGSPELINTHRPDSWRMRPSLDLSPLDHHHRPASAVVRIAFRYFRPPRRAWVGLRQGVPVELRADGLAAARVRETAGPWLSSGDWWTGHPFSRREWDLALDSGLVCRVFEDTLTPARPWFLDGLYD